MPEFYSWEPPKGDLNPDRSDSMVMLVPLGRPQIWKRVGASCGDEDCEGIGFSDLRPRSPFPVSLGVGSHGEDEHSGPS